MSTRAITEMEEDDFFSAAEQACSEIMPMVSPQMRPTVEEQRRLDLLNGKLAIVDERTAQLLQNPELSLCPQYPSCDCYDCLDCGSCLWEGRDSQCCSPLPFADSTAPSFAGVPA